MCFSNLIARLQHYFQIKFEEIDLKKLYEFLMITHPEKAMQGVGLKFPDAKFSVLSDKLSCLSLLGMACFKNNNFQASQQEFPLG